MYCDYNTYIDEKQGVCIKMKTKVQRNDCKKILHAGECQYPNYHYKHAVYVGEKCNECEHVCKESDHNTFTLQIVCSESTTFNTIDTTLSTKETSLIVTDETKLVSNTNESNVTLQTVTPQEDTSASINISTSDLSKDSYTISIETDKTLSTDALVKEVSTNKCNGDNCSLPESTQAIATEQSTLLEIVTASIDDNATKESKFTVVKDPTLTSQETTTGNSNLLEESAITTIKELSTEVTAVGKISTTGEINKETMESTKTTISKETSINESNKSIMITTGETTEATTVTKTKPAINEEVTTAESIVTDANEIITESITAETLSNISTVTSPTISADGETTEHKATDSEITVSESVPVATSIDEVSQTTGLQGTSKYVIAEGKTIDPNATTDIGQKTTKSSNNAEVFTATTVDKLITVDKMSTTLMETSESTFIKEVASPTTVISQEITSNESDELITSETKISTSTEESTKARESTFEDRAQTYKEITVTENVDSSKIFATEETVVVTTSDKISTNTAAVSTIEKENVSPTEAAKYTVTDEDSTNPITKGIKKIVDTSDKNHITQLHTMTTVIEDEAFNQKTSTTNALQTAASSTNQDEVSTETSVNIKTTEANVAISTTEKETIVTTKTTKPTAAIAREETMEESSAPTTANNVAKETIESVINNQFTTGITQQKEATFTTTVTEKETTATENQDADIFETTPSTKLVTQQRSEVTTTVANKTSYITIVPELNQSSELEKQTVPRTTTDNSVYSMESSVGTTGQSTMQEIVSEGTIANKTDYNDFVRVIRIISPNSLETGIKWTVFIPKADGHGRRKVTMFKSEYRNISFEDLN